MQNHTQLMILSTNKEKVYRKIKADNKKQKLMGMNYLTPGNNSAINN